MRKKPPTRRERTLQHQLAEAMDINRNAATALVSVRAERERARVDLGSAQIEINDLKQQTETLKEANDHLAGSAMAEAERQQKHLRKLFRIIFDLSLKLSNRAGYIERVRENDRRYGITADIPTDASVDDIRERLAGAESENARDRIIESVGLETLDQVLGRGAQDDRFLRP